MLDGLLDHPEGDRGPNQGGPNRSKPRQHLRGGRRELGRTGSEPTHLHTQQGTNG